MLTALIRRIRWAALLFALLFLLPLATHALWFRAQGWAANWSHADWSATGILPPPASIQEATVHVMAARTGRWRGIFADHCWIVVKPAGASAYRRYDVVGWGMPVRIDHRPPDGRWYGNAPRIIAAVQGEAAARAIPQIEAAIRTYPYARAGDYAPWPGPNSNSFVAHALAAVPELAVKLPGTAIGKDFQPDAFWWGRTTLGGVGIQAGNWLRVSAGWRDGLEFGLFGAVLGVEWIRPALVLPGWGRIGLTGRDA
ncbi:MAG: DUF3750 domain-containing protein [Beijerinckiaceae bacterium]